MKKTDLKLFAFIVSLLLASGAEAYPDFIGYSYSTCITCHYNGTGGGPLNDYGRALSATEITARDIYSATTDEESIAAQSGFLGKKPLPWWVRPGIQYRGLWFQQNPNSGQTMEKYLEMQNDVSLAFHLDKAQSKVLVVTGSFANNLPAFGEKNSWFAKEYYLRWKHSNNFWTYFGQLDKVFGIRLIDHTAVSRQPLDLGQYSQSQGAVAHWTYPTWDVAANIFIGNSNETPGQRQKGISAAGEMEVGEDFKVGLSTLISESDARGWKLLAASTRMKISKGSAIMAEIGLKEKNDKAGSSGTQLGNYAWLETLVNIRRGYNLLSVVEYSRSDLSTRSQELFKLSMGGLFFPLPRTELRLNVANGKSFMEQGGTPDYWQLQSQIHFSF